jgi:ribosomal protein S18 acetylase RimI-like enzyme
MFFADESSKKTASSETSISSNDVAPVELVASDNEGFLNMAGAFLVDSFWLNSQHHQLGDEDISADARIGLIVEQCADLQEKYGERMGKRLMNACVFGALDPETKDMLGVATLKATLLIKDDILDAEKAEVIAKNAVASLGPKQRRLYKDASIETIATELLSPDTKAVCVLSNLAVSAQARRRGVAKTLCEEAEALARDWGYNEIHLLVESENTPARKLYQDKLGYKTAFTKKSAVAMRADIKSGTFTETKADTLLLAKKI